MELSPFLIRRRLQSWLRVATNMPQLAASFDVLGLIAESPRIYSQSLAARCMILQIKPELAALLYILCTCLRLCVVSNDNNNHPCGA
jgi:hypothetical protein